ncbi:hypothetical protein G6F24_013723 [Rhizopus arrhizus]|nr:hypothetical protein G6F24_013723 [Rhizopus arrhizus]
MGTPASGPAVPSARAASSSISRIRIASFVQGWGKFGASASPYRDAHEFLLSTCGCAGRPRVRARSFGAVPGGRAARHGGAQPGPACGGTGAAWRAGGCADRCPAARSRVVDRQQQDQPQAWHRPRPLAGQAGGQHVGCGLDLGAWWQASAAHPPGGRVAAGGRAGNARYPAPPAGGAARGRSRPEERGGAGADGRGQPPEFDRTDGRSGQAGRNRGDGAGRSCAVGGGRSCRGRCRARGGAGSA